MGKVCSLFSQKSRENLHDKFQGINLTAETVQTNMSSLTRRTTLLNRSLTALLYSKNQHPDRHLTPWNTVSMYIALFRRNNMKQIKIGWKNKISKERTANVPMFRAVRVMRTVWVVNQMTFPHPAISFRGGTTRESSGNRAYTVLSTCDRFVRPCYFNLVP